VILALIFGPGRGLGLGAGSGMGTGTTEGNNNSPAVTAESTASESTASESTAAESSSAASAEESADKTELIVRVHNMEIYVGDVKCEDDEAVLKELEKQLKDGMVLILQDDYADNEAFTGVEKLLDDGAFEYRTETKK